MKRRSNRSARRAGFTLVEILIATSILAAILLTSFAMLSRDADLARSTLGIGAAEMRAQAMLFGLEREIADARGANPRAAAAQAISAAETAVITVDSTLGFPPQGFLLIDREGANIERIAYTALGPGQTSFQNLARGQQCTDATTHAAGVEILWAGTAEPIQLQQNPPANLWDGFAREATGTVFFRGDGTGFSYRVPTDPTGGTDYIDGDELQWGATVGGQPTLAGWAALVYVPRTTYAETTYDDDINLDGDSDDVFDVGQIRRWTWNTANAGVPPSDLGLGPSVVLQERCNWGGDLDGDGFHDPIFLWDPDTRKLHVRLFILGASIVDMPVVRRVESVIFLRNEPEN